MLYGFWQRAGTSGLGAGRRYSQHRVLRVLLVPAPPSWHDRRVTDDTLERLRWICLALPETTERQSHGEPTWFVRDKKTFVTYANHHHDDRLAFWCAAPEGFQRMLVEAAPRRFFVPPYVGTRGWVGIRLDVEPDWDEIERMVEAAYRMVAPRRLVTELDATRRR